MQFSALILHADWPLLVGSALIAGGIGLAVQTLRFGEPRPGVAHLLRAYRPAEWSRRQAAHERNRPMDQAIQLQRVLAIAETGFVRAEAVADLHARATHELEAVDDALIRLLAGFTPDAMQSIRQREADPDSLEIAEPLAA
jgi:hypothetical protein